MTEDCANCKKLEEDSMRLGNLLNLLIQKKRMELADMEAHYSKANSETVK